MNVSNSSFDCLYGCYEQTPHDIRTLVGGNRSEHEAELFVLKLRELSSFFPGAAEQFSD